MCLGGLKKGKDRQIQGNATISLYQLTITKDKEGH